MQNNSPRTMELPMVCFWSAAVGLLCLGTVNPLVFQGENDASDIRPDAFLQSGEVLYDREKITHEDGGDLLGMGLRAKVDKRSAFGLLGLATKRPHKSQAELNYRPPMDGFISVRGRKRSSVFSDSDRNIYDGQITMSPIPPNQLPFWLSRRF